jgi:hypothetical protein
VQKPDIRIINPIINSIGINEVKVGDNVEDAFKTLGQSTLQNGEYFSFYEKGIDFNSESGKVKTIFFYYISKKHKAYRGVTDKGIGVASKITDVLKKYGQPDRIGKSIISQYGQFPGVEDYTMDYYSKGISFTFYDKKLADIRIYNKR